MTLQAMTADVKLGLPTLSPGVPVHCCTDQADTSATVTYPSPGYKVSLPVYCWTDQAGRF